MLKKRYSHHKKGLWQFQEAKAKLSQVLDEVQVRGMQTIIRNKTEIFVLLTKDKFDESTTPSNSLIDFFSQAPYPDVELDIKRSSDLPREFEL